MLVFMNRRRRTRPVILTERGQMLAGLLTAVATLLWICASAKGL